MSIGMWRLAAALSLSGLAALWIYGAAAAPVDVVLTGTATVNHTDATQYQMSRILTSACDVVVKDRASTQQAIGDYAAHGGEQAETVMIRAFNAQAGLIAQQLVLLEAPDPSVAHHINDPTAGAPQLPVEFTNTVTPVDAMLIAVARSAGKLADEFAAGLHGQPVADTGPLWANYYRALSSAHGGCHDFYGQYGVR
jgi:hypothetical protein